jgi:hypothetical protein
MVGWGAPPPRPEEDPMQVEAQNIQVGDAIGGHRVLRVLTAEIIHQIDGPVIQTSVTLTSADPDDTYCWNEHHAPTDMVEVRRAPAPIPVPTADRLRAIFAKSSTATLIESLCHLEEVTKRKPTRETVLSRSWTISELERRFPEAEAAVERAFDENEARIAAGEDPDEVDYVAVLLAAIPLDAAR